MPELTSEEIREEIRSGELRLLSIDTSIFDRFKHSLEHGLLQRLSQFRNTDVQVVLSEIVIGELRAHMINEASEAGDLLKSALKKVGASWNVSSAQREEILVTLLRNHTVETMVEERLAHFLQANEVTVVAAAPNAPIDEVVRRYFQSDAPFGNGKQKKHEFPDALALLSLQGYAAREGWNMLVVSGDGGWKEFADQSRRLVCVSDLADALSYFQTFPLAACARLAQRLHAGELQELTDEVQSAVAGVADGMDLHIEADSAYYYDYSLPEVEVLEVRYEDDRLFVPVEQDGDVYGFELAVLARTMVTCHFTFEMKDWVDKDYIRIGSTTEIADVDMNFRLTVTIEGDPEGAFEVIDVEVIDSDARVDFGEIAPDWGEPEV